jgi:hypothetical protein
MGFDYHRPSVTEAGRRTPAGERPEQQAERLVVGAPLRA